VQRYAGTGGWNDVAADIAVTGAGVATVTGTARDATFDLIALQYDPDGALRWSDLYDPLGYSYEIGIQVALDDAGRAYIVGSELTAAGTNDICVLCYETDGSRAWIRVFDGDPDTYDDGKSIALGDDLVVVTGCSEVDTNDRDVRTIALDMSGNQLWTDRFAGPMIRGDDCGAVALIDDDLITVVGTSDSLLAEEDFLTLRYTASGERVWDARYNGPGNGNDEATGAVVLADGSVLVGGVSPDVTVDFAVVKYAGAGGDDDTSDDDTSDDDIIDDDTSDDDIIDDDTFDDDTTDDDTTDDDEVDDDAASDDDDDNDNDGCGC